MKCPYCGSELSYRADTFDMLTKKVVAVCHNNCCPIGYLVFVAYAVSLKRALKKANKMVMKRYSLTKKVQGINDPSTGD